MEIVFKKGHIVQEGTFVLSIKEIINGVAVFVNNYHVPLEKLSHVKINGIYDERIVLDSIIPVRASFIAPGEKTPIREKNITC